MGKYSQGEDMQKYTILGINLYDYGVREALRRTDSFLKNGSLNRVCYISGSVLAQASKDEEQKRILEEMDMTVCAEPDVLEAAGIAVRSRVREIDEQVYWKEFLRKLARMQRSVYLLADTQDNAARLLDLVDEYQGNMNIAGVGAYQDYDCQPERLANEINGLAPRIIISVMPWPLGAELMYSCGQYVNAELWLSMPDGQPVWNRNTSAASKFMRRLRRRLFERRVVIYNQKK